MQSFGNNYCDFKQGLRKSHMSDIKCGGILLIIVIQNALQVKLGNTVTLDTVVDLRKIR